MQAPFLKNKNTKIPGALEKKNPKSI